jgi:hypothetical protein
MSDEVSYLPVPGVILDLDNEKRPEKDVKPPFIVTVGAKQITFKDPGDIDWRILADITTPTDLVRSALSTEDREHLISLSLPGWKFNRLMESYYTHYDMEDRIAEAQRRARIGL